MRIIHNRRHRGHLSGKLLEECGEGYQARTEGEFAIGKEPTAITEQDAERQLADAVDDGPEDSNLTDDFLLLRTHSLIATSKALQDALLRGQAFDGLHALDGFREIQNQVVHQIAILFVGRSHAT